MTFWRPFCLCKLGGQDLKILLGNRIFWIQHTQIRLKSLVPNFYSKMLLTFTFPRNPTRLLREMLMVMNHPFVAILGIWGDTWITLVTNTASPNLLIICASEWSSQYTLFFEQYRYHLQVDVKAKISLCGHCLMNYFDISLLPLILTFSAPFSHCHYHVIMEVMLLLRLWQLLLLMPNNRKSHLPYIILS